MTFDDRHGCATTIANQEAIEIWNNVQLGFLCHAASAATDLGKTLEADPQFVLGHTCKGLFSLLLGKRELVSVAKEALKTALNSHKENPVTAREQHYLRALEVWLDGSLKAAIHEMEGVLVTHPHDALAMKLSHAIRFLIGDSKGMLESLNRLAPIYEDNHAALGYFRGCMAFALEEAGEYDRAEKLGKRGIELAPLDAWGLHAVTHVYDMTGNAKGGLEWISGKESSWTHCNNFRFHVWWHIALLHLDLGQHDRVMELYDAEIRKEKTDDYRDIANATSVLMRLELDGVNVGDRWEELGQLAATRLDDNCLAFADLHYSLALCGSDKQEAMGTLLTNMKQTGAQPKTQEAAQIIGDPGVVAAAGLEAFRDQNFVAAHEYLAQAMPDLQIIGGSHAQRDVFHRLTIESAIRAGNAQAAQYQLKSRDLRRGHQDGYSRGRWEALNRMSNNVIDAA